MSLSEGACFQHKVRLNGRQRSIMMRGMVIDMNDNQLHTLDQLRAFLGGTVAVDFAVTAHERYEFITRTETIRVGVN